jgi:hypothetical protein
MLRPLSHDKEIPVHCEYEPQNRSVRFPDCKHCEIFCSTIVDRKILTQEVYVEAKFVFRNFDTLEAGMWLTNVWKDLLNGGLQYEECQSESHVTSPTFPQLLQTQS